MDAVAGLHARRPGMRCYIVGDGPDKRILTEAIARHGIEEAMVLVPSCGTEQVALWMGAASLVTLPSYREGCPNVVIEALASGRPVVASDVGGIPELMDESSGRLVPAMDGNALQVALDEVLAQRWDAAAISGRHSRSWSDVTDEVEKMLEQVLSDRARTLPLGG